MQLSLVSVVELSARGRAQKSGMPQAVPQVSLVMASSRVMTLVVTLPLVVTGGIYLLKLNNVE